MSENKMWGKINNRSSRKSFRHVLPKSMRFVARYSNIWSELPFLKKRKKNS